AGTEETAAAACNLVANRGTVVLLAPGAWGPPSGPIVHKELRVLGARAGNSRRQAMELIAEGRLGLAHTISHRFPLADSAAAYAMAENPDCHRVAIDCQQ